MSSWRFEAGSRFGRQRQGVAAPVFVDTGWSTLLDMPGGHLLTFPLPAVECLQVIYWIQTCTSACMLQPLLACWSGAICLGRGALWIYFVLPSFMSISQRAVCSCIALAQLMICCRVLHLQPLLVSLNTPLLPLLYAIQLHHVCNRSQLYYYHEKDCVMCMQLVH
jgi:hypothetical protein